MIRFVKSGTWAVGGIEPRQFEKGQKRDLGPKENADLVAAGWAEYVPAANASEAPERPADKDAPRSQGSKPGSAKA